MKNLILVAFILLTTILKAQTDTIYKSDGEVLFVYVTEISEATIKYTYPGESFTNAVGKNMVSKIHFKSGRKQEFASALNLMRVKSCLEWEKVQISKIESEVTGLFKIDLIGAKAKGITEFSSLAKLQDRAFKKIKIETAMMGGNLAYIMEQNTEEAISGGENGGGKTPGVTISGLAYTSKKVFANEIAEGQYNLAAIYVLRANEYETEQEKVKPQRISIAKGECYDVNGFQKVKLNVHSVSDIKEFTVVYADKNELVLYGLYSSRQGKKTYYNLIFKRDIGSLDQ